MYARVARFEGGRPEGADEAVAEVRQAFPRLQEQVPGLQGILLLMDRSRGTGLALSFFESEDDIRAAEPIFEQQTPSGGARRTSVEVYEVGLQEGSIG